MEHPMNGDGSPRRIQSFIKEEVQGPEKWTPPEPRLDVYKQPPWGHRKRLLDELEDLNKCR
jgi:hypothetical protein